MVSPRHKLDEKVRAFNIDMAAMAAGRLADDHPLLGFVYDSKGRHGGAVRLQAKQIPAFIMHFQHAPRIVITNPLDVRVLEVLGDFVDYCSDPTYLAESILPVLGPMQAGEVEAPPWR